jgi:hypothetical protein
VDKNSKGEETPGLARVLLRFEGDDEVGEEGEEDDDDEEEEEEEDEDIDAVECRLVLECDS